jgi:hypothetical protein
MTESCGIHDLMSAFRLPAQHYIGTGAIENRNGVQLCHNVYDLFKHFKKWHPETWTSLCTELWEHHGKDPKDPELQSLVTNVQEPLMTRWWTVGEVANFLEKFWDIVHNIAWCVQNDTTVGNEENKIAQGMISMMRQPALKVQVSFLARFCKFWLNPHMKFYQRGDIFVKRPGFLCFHRTVGFFLMTQQINDIVKNGWQGHSDFKTTRAALDECEEEDRKILREMVDRFFQGFEAITCNKTFSSCFSVFFANAPSFTPFST